MRKRTIGYRALGIAAALVQTPAGAQSAGVIEEVLVTAQKREESVLSVPISMSVVQAETLTELSVENLDDMQLYVPNFMVTPTPSNSYVFMRGIGTQGVTLSFESSVALFVDGVYGGRNRQFQEPFLDVERVEVLRGPQGALFGRNTSAGAISITSARPTREFAAWALAEYETEFESWSTSGAVSGPVSDKLQLRFAGRAGETGGYVRNTGLGRYDGEREDASARLSAAWQPGETVNAFAKIEYAQGEMTGFGFEFVPGGGEPVLIKETDDGLAPEYDDSDALNALAQFDFELGEHTLTAIAGHSSFEYDNAINIQAITPAHLVVENAEEFDQQSLELRWLSPTGRTLDYIVGVYADRAESIIPSRTSTDLPFTPAYPELITEARYVENTESLAAFAQATWSIRETLRATAGLRYTHIDKEAGLTRSYFAIDPVFASGSLDTPLSMARDEDFVDPSFNVQWDFAPDWMAYASYAEGSKSGGFGGPSSEATEETWMYEDEGSVSVELGVKGALSRGYLSLAVFDTEYTDLQKSVLNVLTASFVTGNAAEAQSRGVELEALWKPFDHLTFSASLAYLDAEYTSYPGAPCPSGGQSSDPNCAPAIPAPPGFPPVPCPVNANEFQPNCTTDLRGVRLTNAPEWSGVIAAQLDAPISDSLKFTGALSGSYRDDVFYQPSYNALEAQGAFWVVDLRLGLASLNERWSAAVLVRNLLDEDSSALIFETFPFFIDPQTDRVHLPDAPRTYTLQLRYQFD